MYKYTHNQTLPEFVIEISGAFLNDRLIKELDDMNASVGRLYVDNEDNLYAWEMGMFYVKIELL